MERAHKNCIAAPALTISKKTDLFPTCATGSYAVIVQYAKTFGCLSNFEREIPLFRTEKPQQKKPTKFDHFTSNSFTLFEYVSIVFRVFRQIFFLFQVKTTNFQISKKCPLSDYFFLLVASLL